MLCLAVDVSVRVATYVPFGSVCQSEVDWIPVFEIHTVSKPVRPMLRYGSTRTAEKNQLTHKYDNSNDLCCIYLI